MTFQQQKKQIFIYLKRQACLQLTYLGLAFTHLDEKATFSIFFSKLSPDFCIHFKHNGPFCSSSLSSLVCLSTLFVSRSPQRRKDKEEERGER